MKKWTISFSAILLFQTIANFANAQAAEASGSGANYLIYGLGAVAVLIFFFLVIQVSDNLLAVESKRLGIDSNGKGASNVFDSLRSLFAAKLPEYAMDKSVVRLSKGFDILLEGEAKKEVNASNQVSTFAVQPPNFVGLSPIPKVLVEKGASVRAGDPLFFDKTRPEIKFVAPVSGEIAAVNRGTKRSIAEVVILADKEIQYRPIDAFDLDNSSREDLVNFLLENGGWTMLRQRPFEVLPEPEEIPRNIFISTFDSAPLAPDLNLVVEGKGEAFQKGLDVLNKLTEGSVFLGLDARNEEPPSAVFTGATGVEKRWFHGKHPYGNVGIQIHHVAPIGSNDKVWILGVQEVITLGAIFSEQRFNAERVIAVVGAELENPKYIKTYLGANIGDLIKSNEKGENNRLISGDVLSGHRKEASQFLDYFDDQLTVIKEGNYYEMFGWLVPSVPKPSISKTFPNFLFPDIKYTADSNTHGERRAFVVTGQYESVLPMDLYPQHLMKAILINDFELMEGLGIRELSEEDIALCEFVCTSKQPLQEILRQGLEVMRKEG